MQTRTFGVALGDQDTGLADDDMPTTGSLDPVGEAIVDDPASTILDSAGPAIGDALPADQPGGRTTWDGISLEHILRDRPDVLHGYLTEFNGPNNDPHSTAWLNRVGGATPEDYADYWYRTYGRASGYGQPPSDRAGHAPDEQPAVRTTSDGVPLSQILRDRPDVFQAFFTEYYGPHNDRHSHAWIDRVGGATPEDYARYWYESGGRYAYTPSQGGGARSPLEPADYAGGRTTSDGVYLDQILHDRPDVFQAFFTEYYGPNNDRHSSAWMDRVGGATPQDYAKYWYEHGGKYSYTPEPAKIDPPDPGPADQDDGHPDEGAIGEPGPDPMAPGAEDASAGGDEDGDGTGEPQAGALPDEPAWTPPDAEPDYGDDPDPPVDPGLLTVGQTLASPDPFG